MPDERMIDVQGHRGARALFPENTLEGFLAAARLGVAAFELDVGMTCDGIVVLSHDARLNPDLARESTGAWLPGPGPFIHAISYAELLGYDFGRLRPKSRTAALFPEQQPIDGARIPTLASVLAALPDVRFTIEVKTNPFHPEWTAPPADLAEAVIDVVEIAGAAQRVVVEAFDWRVQRHVRQRRPDIRLAWLTQAETVQNAAIWRDLPVGFVSVSAQVAAEGGPIWAPDYSDLTLAQIQEAQRLGLRVLPWTVNKPDDMRRMVAWGVDGLISDRPDLALQISAT